MSTAERTRTAAGSVAKKAVKRYLWIKLGIPGMLIVLGLAALMLLVMLAGAVAGGKQSTPSSIIAATCGSPGVIQVAARPSGLTGEQVSNSQAIAGVALSLGLGSRGVQVGTVAALTESGMRNLNYGDISSKTGLMTTSRGMFQMKDAWGSLADRLDPVKAATLFYTVDKGPGVRGLIHIPGWQSMSITDAAQSVEQSQFANGSNYAALLAQSERVTADLMAAHSDMATPAATACSATAPPKLPGTGGTGFTGVMNNSQDPSTFGWKIGGPTVPLVFQGRNFGQVAAGTQGLWLGFLTELVPLIPGGLTSDLGCLDVRRNVNSPGKWSFHAYGLACDINSGANPNGASAQSLQGRPFALPMITRDIAARHCMEWGGDFTGTPDPMHAEIHCSPTQIH